MEKTLTFCKSVISFFDRIEESRPLASHEFLLRCKVKEKAYALANNIEERWRQRARCNWLKNGDKNTKFFHARASARQSRNRVLSIRQGDRILTEPIHIQEAFLEQMRLCLGTSNETLDFDAQDLYNPSEELGNLDDPFTPQEVEMAVFNLAKNKASGLDGIPNEFLQSYWLDLKEQVMTIVQGFYSNTIHLAEVNKVNIVMIPQKDSPTLVTDSDQSL